MLPAKLDKQKLRETKLNLDDDSNSTLSMMDQKIVVMDNQECIFLKVQSICYIEGEGSYSNIFLRNGTKMIVSKNLKVLVDRLNKAIFLRIHNSYVINVNFINKYVKKDGGYLIMENGATIPISIRKKDILTQLVQRLSL